MTEQNECPDDEQLVILVTEEEADEMSVLTDQLGSGKTFEWVVETVLGKLVRRRTERYQNVGFVVVAVPYSIDENGDMICRMTM